jgi:hypothetical protein
VVRFVRVGTLDEPDRLPPDIHIFTASKQPWVVILMAPPLCPSTTIANNTGRRRASRDGWHSCRRSPRGRRACGSAGPRRRMHQCAGGRRCSTSCAFCS